MQSQQERRTIKKLMALLKEQMLKANPEYQRGVVWSDIQKKKLVDSILRGYPIPLIYLHHITRKIDDMQRDDLEIVDGQQRINAIHTFIEGGIRLFDPKLDAKVAKFPAFITEQPCPWARKDFQSLSPALQEQLLSTELPVAIIKSEVDNEVRDLFIRLQSGLPLNGQEARDAWPGGVTEFVLKLGGKPDIVRYPGHPFFREALRMKPERDRGKTRQLAAQIAMLFLNRRQSGEGAFIDINSSSLNDFYYQNLSFASDSPDAHRLLRILDTLAEILRDGKRPKLHGHDAIHLVLFVDTLWDDYAPTWKSRLLSALDAFLKDLAEEKHNYSSPFSTEYSVLTKAGSDKASAIATRHRFYVAKMMSYMADLPKLDPQRAFGEAERAAIYYRQKKRCAVCGAEMHWSDVQIHHVEEHGQGGKTALENGAAVHIACHPKGKKATAAFAQSFKPLA